MMNDIKFNVNEVEADTSTLLLYLQEMDTFFTPSERMEKFFRNRLVPMLAQLHDVAIEFEKIVEEENED
jgi:hypothetical protein